MEFQLCSTFGLLGIHGSLNDKSYFCLTTDRFDLDVSEFKKPMYMMLYGLVNAFRMSVSLDKRWCGDRVQIVEAEHPYAWVEIDYQHEFDLARKLMEDI